VFLRLFQFKNPLNSLKNLAVRSVNAFREQPALPHRVSGLFWGKRFDDLHTVKVNFMGEL